ncbi:hypothetical protein D9619_011132 [Psilocybe cf. subviscida]|uniref:Uncharacterized protein n=1 Tax=Psilocybe cf. subviscida TaxID=2480587 RepID=A0A8H5F540_9AGAR|nr:hypothetical protein D9619_011132 [Psilocybe cf. subviscida]
MFLVTPLLDSSFNALVLAAFISGIYLLLFIQALWKLVKRRAHVPYICALVLLWMLITCSLIISWLIACNAFVVDNSSPVSIMAAFDNRLPIVEAVPTIVAIVVSNGIIIWRCYVIWRTIWSLAILVPLLLASLACDLYLAVIRGDTGALMGGLSQVLSATTTVCATGMILLKIILVTQKSRARYSYSKVIEILVQSAALESFVQIVASIAAIVSSKVLESSSFNVSLVLFFLPLGAYASSCRLVVLGIAPTLIAFRVADEKPRIETKTASRTSPLSKLTFRRSTGSTDAESGAQRS